MAAPAKPDERLVVALVRGVHGLKGTVRVEVLTDRPEERYAPGAVLHPEGSPAPLTVVESGPDNPGWLVRFREVPDRDAADRLRGRYLDTLVTPAEVHGPDEFYWHEVVGAIVRDRSGAELGRVVDVYRAGGVDAYVVRGDAHGEWDLPAVRDFIVEFDPRGGSIVVDAERLELGPPPSPRRPRAPRATRPAPTSAGGGSAGPPARPEAVTSPDDTATDRA